MCDRILGALRDALGEAMAGRHFGAGGAMLRWDSGRLVVEAPTRFAADLLHRRFEGALTDAIRAVTGASDAPPIVFSIAPEGSERSQPSTGATAPWAAPARGAAQASPERRARTRQRKALGSLRRLDDFVVGPGSALAFREATRLAEAAEHEQVCPLFLHGECGLGKTHLLQGVVERFRERRPGARVRWTTGEAFTNSYIGAIKANAIDRFRREHRDLDLLCVDDVHFLANKTATQTELLHTFDAIGACGARLAMASDAHPRQIANFSEKLVSRFLAGMVVRLDRPDLATRVEIVRRFFARRGLVVEPAVASAVAERCEGSVRDLEGAVIRVEAVHRLLGEGGAVIGASCVARALGGADIGGVRRPVAVRDIAQRVGAALAVDLDELFGASRHKRVVLARSLTASLARELTTLSFPEIARELNKSNHSTVITQCKRIAEQIEADEAVDAASGRSSLRALHASLRAEIVASARRA